MSLSVINLKKICKSYFLGTNEFKALREVNLKVTAGELVAIIGSSGSGKSSLMNIMGLLDRATSGQYYITDQEVSKLNDDQLAYLRNQMIGFVFQSFFLLPRMSAWQNVGLPLLYRNIKKNEIKERSMDLLQKVGLGKFTDRKPNELSGGQQQRVAIARALVGQPKLILADEPTGALDTRTSQEVMDLFLSLNNHDKTTVIIITHETKVAEQCRRIIRIEDGQLSE